MAIKKDEAGLAAMRGPVLYCSGCYRPIGTYGVAKGEQGTPKPGGRCPACRSRTKGSKPKREAKTNNPKTTDQPKAKKKGNRRERAAAALAEVSSPFKSSSVRTVSGGLPTLGRGHR